jgi:hypothetical protein
MRGVCRGVRARSRRGRGIELMQVDDIGGSFGSALSEPGKSGEEWCLRWSINGKTEKDIGSIVRS